MTDYQPAVIFSDAGEWDEDEDFWKTKEFLAWLYNNAPNKDEVVVNDRWAKGMVGQHGDYFSSEYQDLEGVGAEPSLGGKPGHGPFLRIQPGREHQPLPHLERAGA